MEQARGKPPGNDELTQLGSQGIRHSVPMARHDALKNYTVDKQPD
jgi:hypothetical protein